MWTFLKNYGVTTAQIETAEFRIVLSYGMKTTSIERKSTNGDY